MDPVIKDFPAYKIANECDEKGRLFAVPDDAGPVLLYVRKDIFDKCGIPMDIPTWDEYIEIGKKFRGAGYYVATYKKGSGESTLFNLLYHQQGKVYFDREDNPTLNSPEAKETLRLIKEMVDADILLDAKVWSPVWYSALKAGKIVAWPMAQWQANDMIFNIKTEEEGFGKWRVADLPAIEKGGARVSNLGGSCVVLPKGDHVAEAWQYLKWVTTSLEARRASLIHGNFPAWYPMYRDPAITTQYGLFGGQPIYKVFAETMEGMPVFYYSRYYQEATEILESELARYFGDEVSLEKTLEKIQSRLLKVSRG
jgi:ABC-type glycerol-3-phosphate transport system substrate-binding protein